MRADILYRITIKNNKLPKDAIKFPIIFKYTKFERMAYLLQKTNNITCCASAVVLCTDKNLQLK